MLRQKQLSAEHASYAAHNPDLRALLSDCIQHLLTDKPTDVLDFFAQYFDAFSAGYAAESLDVPPAESGCSAVVAGGGSGDTVASGDVTVDATVDTDAAVAGGSSQAHVSASPLGTDTRPLTSSMRSVASGSAQ